MKRQQATHTLRRTGGVLSDILGDSKGEVRHECLNCSATFLDPLDGIGAPCPAFENEPAAILANVEETRQPE